MKNFTVPEVSSLDTNEIKDLFSVSKIPEKLRIIQLTGTPVRIELNVDRYVEIQSTVGKIKLKDYSKLFEKLLDYFYNTTYLYGVANDGYLNFYDVYTNENFLSTLDMIFLEQHFGFPIVNPIAEGNFSFSYLLEVLNKKINGEKIKVEEIHLLPSVYIDDKREKKAIKPEINNAIIYGEKKAYKVWDGTTPTIPQTIAPKTKPENKQKKKRVFLLTTKLERATIFNEVYKNILKRIDDHKNEMTEECKSWWKKYGKGITYLYAIHTLPQTRQIVYDYAKSYYLPIEENSNSLELKWAELFIDFFEEEYPDETKIDYDTEDFYMFAYIFKDELTVFDQFFVKETDIKDDWRYCQNSFNSIGGLYDYDIYD